MSKLKLGPLPKRTPVKVTSTFPPEIYDALTDYARIYESAYGNKETIDHLVPYIVEAFLASDGAFKKARRDLPPATDQKIHQPPAHKS